MFLLGLFGMVETWYVSLADVERKGPHCIADLVACGLSPFLILGDICVVLLCLMSARHIAVVLILSSVVFLPFSFDCGTIYFCRTHCSSADLVLCSLSLILIPDTLL